MGTVCLAVLPSPRACSFFWAVPRPLVGARREGVLCDWAAPRVARPCSPCLARSLSFRPPGVGPGHEYVRRTPEQLRELLKAAKKALEEQEGENPEERCFDLVGTGWPPVFGPGLGPAGPQTFFLHRQ